MRINKILCDHCGTEVTEGGLDVINVHCHPEADIKLELCHSCAKLFRYTCKHFIHALTGASFFEELEEEEIDV